MFNLPKVGQRGKLLSESAKGEERPKLEGTETCSSPVQAHSSPKWWIPDGCPAVPALPTVEMQVPQRPTSCGGLCCKASLALGTVSFLFGGLGGLGSWLFLLSGNGIARTTQEK